MNDSVIALVVVHSTKQNWLVVTIKARFVGTHRTASSTTFSASANASSGSGAAQDEDPNCIFPPAYLIEPSHLRFRDLEPTERCRHSPVSSQNIYLRPVVSTVTPMVITNI